MIEIAIIGKPTDEQRQAFKEAKVWLGFGDMMKFTAAQPGSPRVIVFGTDEDHMPDFACEWMTLYHSDLADVQDALAWYTGAQDDWRAAGIDLWLERTMGATPVREVASL